jgi:hypothetical protein
MQILLWLTILYFWIGSYVYHWTPLGSRSEKFIPDTAYFLVVTMTTVSLFFGREHLFRKTIV